MEKGDEISSPFLIYIKINKKKIQTFCNKTYICIKYLSILMDIL